MFWHLRTEREQLDPHAKPVFRRKSGVFNANDRSGTHVWHRSLEASSTREVDRDVEGFRLILQEIQRASEELCDPVHDRLQHDLAQSTWRQLATHSLEIF